MRIRIAIDPNVRVRGNGTYAGFEDVQWALTGLTGLQVGDAVEVFERESDLTGEGRVTEIDLAKRLVYVSVEWSTLRPRVEPPQKVPARPSLVILQGGAAGGADSPGFYFAPSAHVPELSVATR
jgi:hypothetical protein